MALHPYGILKGRVLNRRHALGGRNRHYQIEVKEQLQHCRVSVNICSQDYPSELEVAIIEPFHHPLTYLLAGLHPGFTTLPKRPGGLALDYIRGNPARPADFEVLPTSLPGPDNDLNDRLDALVLRCASLAEGFIYAYGQPWGPMPGVYDDVFHFAPAAGLHNVHMNQGNSTAFAQDDGLWQDGGLVFQFGTGPGDWAAVFLKFQSQSWHTDDESGHRLPETDAANYRGGRRETPQARGGLQPTVRLESAVINGPGQPERERVRLRNTGKSAQNLAGWSLANWEKQVMALPGLELAAGESVDLALEPPLALSNRGGILSLLDSRGWKVDGVAYAREDARVEGGIVTFT